MAIVLNPITLPASKFLAAMTSLIGDVRFHDTLSPSDIVNDLVDSCRIGKVDYGKGIVNTFKVDLQPVKELSETSSAFTITKPQVAQETIEIDEYNFVPISTSEILSRDALLSGDMVSNFFEFVMSLLEDTVRFNMFDVANALYQEWTPGQSTQTISIDQIDTTGLTGVELNAAEEWNATEIGKVMRKTLNNMKIKNSKFTDVATYTNSNTSQSAPVVSALRADDLKIVFNDVYYTNFIADTLASLYHSEKVGEMIPGDKFVLIPQDAMKTGNEKVIAWLSSKNKFAIADFYKVTLSIMDPSTTYTNTFLHFSYGAGVFKYAPGVKFVANVIKPTPAG